MEAFCTHFGLNATQLLALLESIAGETLTDLAVASSVTNLNHTETQLVTFRYALQSGQTGEVTVFVKKCVWKGKPEAVHYRYLTAHLTALGIPHEYEEHPGGHDWPYWDTHIQDTLNFLCGMPDLETR